ncbi:hypothetical protein [Nonomuraea sp. NPDC049400]|uniref:hypothetical protein n=1 Tax=Nonomuraea sp. NPDC049400 TaxID=3364352 RepID=UPI00379E1C70
MKNLIMARRRPMLLRSRALRLMLGITLGFVSMPVLASAASASSAFADGCRTLEITLNGSKHTSRCLDSNDSVAPLTWSTRCTGNESDIPYLALFWNGPLDVDKKIFPGGPTVCIRGRGWIDLNATMGDGLNWNDKASAWWAGCSSGHFDEHAGLFPGRQQYFNAGNKHWGNFDGKSGRLPNDSLSVVTLDSDC